MVLDELRAQNCRIEVISNLSVSNAFRKCDLHTLTHTPRIYKMLTQRVQHSRMTNWIPIKRGQSPQFLGLLPKKNTQKSTNFMFVQYILFCFSLFQTLSTYLKKFDFFFVMPLCIYFVHVLYCFFPISSFHSFLICRFNNLFNFNCTFFFVLVKETYFCVTLIKINCV